MLSAALPEAHSLSWLEEAAAAAPWCVVVGRPSPDLLTQIQQCAGQLLVVVPDPLLQENLEQWIHPWPERLQLRVVCVGPDAAEVDWWLFNDSRFNGPMPLEHWLSVYPNLRLVGQERRQQQPLAAVLSEHFSAQQRGLLVVVDEADRCVASLSGLGATVECIEALAVVPVQGEIDPGLEPLVAPSACLKLIQHDQNGFLWRFDALQKLALVEAERDSLINERDALVNERDALIGRLADSDARMERINAELDEILALIDSAHEDEPVNA